MCRTLIGLVRDNTLKIKDAAARCNMTNEAFELEMKKR